MSKPVFFLLAGLLAAGAAAAQSSTDSHGVSTSTDPARAAAVEQQAQELRAAQHPMHGKAHHARHHKATHHMAQHHKAAKKSA